MLSKAVKFLMIFTFCELNVDSKDCSNNDHVTSVLDSLTNLAKQAGHCGCSTSFTNPQPVALYAVLSKELTVSGLPSVVYDKVYTNIGASYDNVTGNFRAPAKGIFYFAVTLMSKYGFDILISREYAAAGRHEMGSIHATLGLEKGDIVNIQHDSGANTQILNGDEYCSFNGCLLNTCTTS